MTNKVNSETPAWRQDELAERKYMKENGVSQDVAADVVSLWNEEEVTEYLTRTTNS